jgi:hypothetical protein
LFHSEQFRERIAGKDTKGKRENREENLRIIGFTKNETGFLFQDRSETINKLTVSQAPSSF